LTLTFELGRDFCTLHLTAKFHRSKFNRSEVIVLTNKQTPLKATTSLCYATPVGNKHKPPNDVVILSVQKFSAPNKLKNHPASQKPKYA